MSEKRLFQGVCLSAFVYQKIIPSNSNILPPASVLLLYVQWKLALLKISVLSGTFLSALCSTILLVAPSVSAKLVHL